MTVAPDCDPKRLRFLVKRNSFLDSAWSRPGGQTGSPAPLQWGETISVLHVGGAALSSTHRDYFFSTARSVSHRLLLSPVEDYNKARLARHTPMKPTATKWQNRQQM